MNSADAVFAFGARNFYGPEGAHRPLGPKGAPVTLSEVKRRCPYFQQHYAKRLSPEAPEINTGWDPLGLAYPAQYPESSPRYIYDEAIDVEDTYSAVMRYRNGASLAYSCNFSTPWEGYVLGINGTEGRIEMSHHSNPDPTGSVPTGEIPAKVRLLPLFGGEEEIVLPKCPGGHGGSDPFIQRDLFLGPSPDSRALSLVAGSMDGAIAVAQGEAVFRAIETKLPVSVPASLAAAGCEVRFGSV